MPTPRSWWKRSVHWIIVLLLLVSTTALFPQSVAVRAATEQTNHQQIDQPIDNTLANNEGGGIIPASPDLYTIVVGEADGPDVTQPGTVDVPPTEEAEPETPLAAEPAVPLEGLDDYSLSENADKPVVPSVVPPTEMEAPSPESIESVPDLTLPESGVLLDENQTEAVFALTGNLDDFDRANGPLGGSWTDKVSGITIVNSLAQTTFGNTTAALSIHNAVGVNAATARISNGGAGHTQYVGMVFNYLDGDSFIFIKIQDNNGDGLFDTAGCYSTNNGGGFGLGFFTLSGTLSAATLHVTVSSNRSVSISLTSLSGGGGDQNYVCDNAPLVKGAQFGINSYGGGRIDTVTVNAPDPSPFTSFTTQNGPLGSHWWVHAGIFEVVDQKALGKAQTPHLATYNGLGGYKVEADISLLPGGGTQYAGLVLNFDEGINDAFLKVQDGDGNGDIDHGACYLGNNGDSGSFGLGYFSLSTPIHTAHMSVSLGDDRVVHISLTHIDGGAGSQAYDCTGAPTAEGYGVGIASYGGGRVDNFQVTQDFMDNFNRANNTLGSNWIKRSGNIDIVSQKAVGISGSALATFNGVGASSLEADVSLTPGGGTQYSALILNYGAGTNDLFIKVQDNNGGGAFNTAGCYLGNNSGSFGLGFFNLTASFTTAHMVVSVDTARVVTLAFTNINGGSGAQVYVCSGAPAAEGSAVGIAAYGPGQLDNVRVNRVFAYDAFNRPTGSLGPSWRTRAGTMALVDQTARGMIDSSSLTTFSHITGNQVEGDIAANPDGQLNFAAFVLNYKTGSSNLFIKFQNQDTDVGFEKIGCYTGNNGTGFGPGFFNLTSPVNTAHVKIWVNSARTVTILLTRVNGGTANQLYSCAGAPPAEGNLVGLGSFHGGRVDNVRASEFAPTVGTFLPMIMR